MDIDDLRVYAFSLQHFGCFQGSCYRQPCSDNRHILSFAKYDTLSKFKFIVRPVINDRNRQTAEPQIHRTVICRRRFRSHLCLYNICRIDNHHSGNRPHQGDIFIALVSRTILTDRNACVAGSDFHIQMWISDGIPHLFKCASCCEHRKRACKRNLSRRSQPCRNTHHIRLRNPAVDMTLRKDFLKHSCLSCCCKV